MQSWYATIDPRWDLAAPCLGWARVRHAVADPPNSTSRRGLQQTDQPVQEGQADRQFDGVGRPSAGGTPRQQRVSAAVSAGPARRSRASGQAMRRPRPQTDGRCGLPRVRAVRRRSGLCWRDRPRRTRDCSRCRARRSRRRLRGLRAVHQASSPWQQVAARACAGVRRGWSGARIATTAATLVVAPRARTGSTGRRRLSASGLKCLIRAPLDLEAQKCQGIVIQAGQS